MVQEDRADYRRRMAPPTGALPDEGVATSIGPHVSGAARSWASSPSVRKSMQGNRSRDTSPELALRRELHRRGLRFRVNVPVPGMPRRTIDIALKSRKVAVFVDGCFWHGCPSHFVTPRAHEDYWKAKVARNVARDLETRRHLGSLGWRVVICWEHEDLLACAERVEVAVKERQSAAARGVGG